MARFLDDESDLVAWEIVAKPRGTESGFSQGFPGSEPFAGGQKRFCDDVSESWEAVLVFIWVRNIGVGVPMLEFNF